MGLTTEQASEYGKMGGRKGYEFEQEQLDRMRKVLDKDLSLVERLQDRVAKGEELNEREEKLLQLTASRVSKIYDKLHASKTDVTSDGKQITINIAKEIADQNEINGK